MNIKQFLLSSLLVGFYCLPILANDNTQSITFMLTQRRDNISYLIDLINNSKDESSGGELHLAIQALGKMRAVEAVKPLMKKLSFLPKGEVVIEEEIPTEAYYPVVQALKNIGLPAVELVISEKLMKKSDSLEQELALWIVRSVLGKDLTLKHFDGLMSKSSDFNKKFKVHKSKVLSASPRFGYPSNKK